MDLESVEAKGLESGSVAKLLIHLGIVMLALIIGIYIKPYINEDDMPVIIFLIEAVAVIGAVIVILCFLYHRFRKAR